MPQAMKIEVGQARLPYYPGEIVGYRVRVQRLDLNLTSFKPIGKIQYQTEWVQKSLLSLSRIYCGEPSKHS